MAKGLRSKSARASRAILREKVHQPHELERLKRITARLNDPKVIEENTIKMQLTFAPEKSSMDEDNDAAAAIGKSGMETDSGSNAPKVSKRLANLPRRQKKKVLKLQAKSSKNKATKGKNFKVGKTTF